MAGLPIVTNAIISSRLGRRRQRRRRQTSRARHLGVIVLQHVPPRQPVGLYSMLEAELLPELAAYLVAALADLECDYFSRHGDCDYLFDGGAICGNRGNGNGRWQMASIVNVVSHLSQDTIITLPIKWCPPSGGTNLHQSASGGTNLHQSATSPGGSTCTTHP